MSDRWSELRDLCYAVAESEHGSRKQTNRSVVLGVHLLVYKVRLYESTHMMFVHDEATVRRRYNELVTEVNPRMRHVGTEQEKFFDHKPNPFHNEKTGVYDLQSCYTVNKPEDAARIESDIRRAYLEKRFGRQQVALA